ncbi:type IV pilin protein [Rhodoferax sp.]|uniref:type IV pilin protein n=1 Tax=Rhodoferax sp. TaxID=50421 RepID=UPI00261FB080|nr:type IV pilin protein [Rhodoferax sp.]MDD2920362.1 type IV pilin protein [Rhodoferax sp.]
MTCLTSNRNDRCSSKVNGFTVIEVMITVAIVAILASLAYPNYMSQVRKSRRSDAVQALSQVQQTQERWRANAPTYTSALSAAPPNGFGLSSTTSGGYYTLAISSNTATGYVATATGVSGKSQTGDTGCTTLTVTVTNGSAVNTPTECWSQ